MESGSEDQLSPHRQAGERLRGTRPTAVNLVWGVQRAMVMAEAWSGTSVAELRQRLWGCADALADRPAVHGFERDDLQDEEVQRALNEIRRLAHDLGGPVGDRQEHIAVSCR